MARLTRQVLKLLGSLGNSTSFAQFGSYKGGSYTSTKDVATIQALGAWLTGLQDSLYGANNLPILEEFNGLFYVMAYQLVYGFQEGIPEYDSTFTYYIGSIVKKTGTSELYGSLTNGNVGNALPSQTDNANWHYINPTSNEPVGAVSDFAGSSLPAGWFLCDGSAVSRTTYSALYAVIGTTYGIGDGSLTFNLPDCRGRVTVGAGTGAGLTARALAATFGEENHLVSSGEMASHTHTINDPSHKHGGYYFQVALGGEPTSDPYSPVTPAGNLRTTTATTGITISNSGGGGVHNNIQPAIVLNKIIKY
jgi:microcystin-dependent protein